LSEELDDQARLGKGFYSYGDLLDVQGRKDSALYYIQKSLVIHTNLQDSTRLIANYNALGNLFMNVGEHDSSIVYYLKAAQLAELTGNRIFLGAIYNNLGKMFRRMLLYEKSRYYLGLALELNKEYNNLLMVVQSLSHLGTLMAMAGNLDSALFYFDLASEEIKPLKVIQELGDLNNNYAIVFEQLDKPDDALEYFKKAFEIYSEIGYLEGTTIALKNIGRMFSIKGNYSLAQVYLDSALNVATKAGYSENRRLILEDIKDNYHRAGNDKKAFEYYELFFALYDSMLNVDKVKAMDELEKKYQKQKDQATILSLEKENLKKTNQRNTTVFIATIILALILFALVYFRQRARKDRIISQQKIRQLEEEKKLLSAKLLIEGQEEERKRIALELHDGLGVLLSATKLQFTSIADISPENKPLIDRATHLLEQATGDVRRISHNMMPGLLTKMGFYEAVGDMIDNINDTPEINAVFVIEGDQSRLPENKEIMLYRVVQEMVNNTLKYARAKNITLKVVNSDSYLNMIYSDDGVGFDLNKILESPNTNIGLKSIESRIGFLNGEIKLETSPGHGVRYAISVPL
jgi:signal transduction histidine kinase